MGRKARMKRQRPTIFQNLVMGAIDKSFPVREVKIRNAIRRKENAKRKLFQQVGRFEGWAAMHIVCASGSGRPLDLSSNSARQFYYTVKNYKWTEGPEQYSVWPQ